MLLPLNQIAKINSAFSAEVPGLQVSWDSTSAKAFYTCPYYYYLKIIQGLDLPSKAVDLTFGIAWHSAQERYRKLVASGSPHSEALFWTIAYTYWTQISSSHEECVPEGKPGKTSHTLIRALVAYFDTFGENDKLQTLILPSGKPAVELSFRFPLDPSGKLPFEWSGHIDQLATLGSQLDLSKVDPSSLDPHETAIYSPDYKTTTWQLNATYWSQWDPDIQMLGYRMAQDIILPNATAAKGIVIDAASITVTGQNFGRNFIKVSQPRLDEFYADLLFNLDQARQMAQAKTWPMRPTSCRRYGRDCEFRQICVLSPALRPAFLESGFVRRVWNPTTER